MADTVPSLDNDSSSSQPRRACSCKKRVWKRRHFFALFVFAALHKTPGWRCFNFWRGVRDETIFPSKNIRGRLLSSGAYICQGNETHPISPADYGVENFHAIQIPIKDELCFHQGYFLAQPNSENVPTLIWFHNTTENVGGLIPDLCEVYRKLGVNIVCADMRGFGTCEGTPSGATMSEDARRITKYVVQQLSGSGIPNNGPRIDRNKIFVFGHGLASHAALETASHPEVRDLVQGAILSDPLPDILSSQEARESLAPNYWLRAYYPDRFDNIELIKNCNRKLLVLGKANGLNPTVETLNELVKDAKYSPHHVALIGGIDNANSLTKLSELPASFVKLVEQFFDPNFTKDTGDHSFFETASFNNEDFVNSVNSSSVCKRLKTRFEEHIKPWNDYLQKREVDNPSELTNEQTSFMDRVRGVFA